MDIERALRNMGKTNREYVKDYVEAYLRTGNKEYAGKAIEILENYDDDPNVKELIKTLKK